MTGKTNASAGGAISVKMVPNESISEYAIVEQGSGEAIMQYSIDKVVFCEVDASVSFHSIVAGKRPLYRGGPAVEFMEDSDQRNVVTWIVKLDLNGTLSVRVTWYIMSSSSDGRETSFEAELQNIVVEK